MIDQNIRIIQIADVQTPNKLNPKYMWPPTNVDSLEESEGGGGGWCCDGGLMMTLQVSREGAAAAWRDLIID